MRVTSDKQTLILAGEAIPRRDLAEPRLTIVATRADDTMLLTQGDFAHRQAAGTVATGMLSRSSYPSSRGSSFNAANEYARTQDLPGNGNRTAIIDTYA